MPHGRPIFGDLQLTAPNAGPNVETEKLRPFHQIAILLECEDFVRWTRPKLKRELWHILHVV